VGSVGVVLIALSAGLVVCCCRKKPGPTNVINGNVEEKSALHLPTGDSSVTGPMIPQEQQQQLQQQLQRQLQHQHDMQQQQQQQQVSTGYMTLPLKSLNQYSGNLLPPAVGQGRYMEKVINSISKGLSIITLSSAPYSDKALL